MNIFASAVKIRRKTVFFPVFYRSDAGFLNSLLLIKKKQVLLDKDN